MVTIHPMSFEFDEYRRDESRSVGEAASISFPADESEVIQVLTSMDATGTPVTIQGGRTGLAAGAVPHGGHIMNLRRMDHVLGMRADGDGFIVSVEPGVVLSQFRKDIEDKAFSATGWDDGSLEALRKFKASGEHFFPTDPTEVSATIGGMVACNASGARSYAFGAVRPHVMGLRAVLTSGDVVDLRRGQCMAEGLRLVMPTVDGGHVEVDLPPYAMPATKNASGYYAEPGMDAIDLWVGSDGTLGAITRVDVRIQPLPPVIWGVSCFFASEGDAVRFVMGARPALGCATAFEYFDGDALAILAHQKASSPAFAALPDVDPAARACVYVELQCDSEEAALGELATIGDLMAGCGGEAGDTWVARTSIDRETQRFFRHAVPESVNMLIDERRKAEPAITKLGSDMSVPDDRLPDVVALYRAALAEAGLQSAVWGHIGNNHLHVNILPRDMADYALGKKLMERWAAAVARMGGAVSAEHGVGKIKRGFLTYMYGAEGIRAMAATKRALDPKGILGRGNLFPPEVCDEGGAILGSIVVCVKAVPSTTEVRMDPVTHTIIRDGRLSVVNPFDQSALEVAVRLKEELGGKVTAMSMGIPDTVRLLRDCLGRGADRGLLLSDRTFAGADTLATSYALNCGLDVIAREDGPVRLIVCGKMAVDGDTAQIGPELAGLLGIPCVTNVCEVIDATPRMLRLRRLVDDGSEEVEVDLPAVITVTKDIVQPRMPSIAGVRWSVAGPVDVYTAPAAGADPARCGLAGSPTQVVRSFTPDRAASGVRVTGTPAEQAAYVTELLKGLA